MERYKEKHRACKTSEVKQFWIYKVKVILPSLKGFQNIFLPIFEFNTFYSHDGHLFTFFNILPGRNGK